MSRLLTDLLFAPTPTITMVKNIVLVDIEGLISDWDAYTFSLDIPSPGKKVSIIQLVIERTCLIEDIRGLSCISNTLNSTSIVVLGSASHTHDSSHLKTLP